MADSPFNPPPHRLFAPVAALETARAWGIAWLRQETDPVRRRELEQLLAAFSRGSEKALNTLLALGPVPVTMWQRERENAGRAAWLEDRKRRTEGKYTHSPSSDHQAQKYTKVHESYNSLDADPTRRERERKEALEQARREQERQEHERRERERRDRELAIQRQRDEKVKVIESWNQHFIKYRNSKNEFAASYVLQKLGLSLYDNNAGEKFYNMFLDSVSNGKREGNYIEKIVNTFKLYQYYRHKNIIDSMASLFGGNKDFVNKKVQEELEKNWKSSNWGKIDYYTSNDFINAVAKIF